MLTELHIEDLGVIARLDLTFGPGMTAVTGETGAGKTMLVEAFELLVGGRPTRRSCGPAPRGPGRRALRQRRRPSSCCRASCRPTAVRGPTSTAARHRRRARRRRRGPRRPARPARPPEPAGRTDAAGCPRRVRRGRHGPLRTARARLTVIEAELAALGGAARERAREIDLLRFQVDELAAAAARRRRTRRRGCRRPRTCSPTPSATGRPAPRCTRRSPPTAGPATPSPPRSGAHRAPAVPQRRRPPGRAARRARRRRRGAA